MLAVLVFATAAASAPVVTPADPLDRVRCVRDYETGSLSRVRKTCHTEREWLALQSDTQRETQRAMDAASARGGG
ncbi:MAG: hypothetical protein H0X36_04005 [Sphingomonadaceae bacterium]|nr:hypothetical protein [Sphingomonadaceae bacterium]